jgi:hypothetical protein
MTAAHENSNNALAGLALALALLITFYHLGSARAGYSQYRDQHLGTALEYSKGSINLLKPVIVGFNATKTPTVLELPLWQAAAGLVFKLTNSTWFGWANLTSLLLFATGIWPLLQVATQWLGRRGAWWTVSFFLCQPLVILNSGCAATDGLSLMLMIWFIYLADRLISTGGFVWWALAALLGCLLAVTKLPFFMAAGLGASFLLVSAPDGSRSLSRRLLLGGVGLVGAVAFVCWSRYADHQSSLAEFPLEELRLSHNPVMRRHFFGDWAYRLDVFNWAKGGWRILVGTLGSFALVPLAVGGLWVRNNVWPKGLLLGAFLTTLVFTHLVLVHTHYYLMLCPAVAMLCAGALLQLEEVLPVHWTNSALFVPAVGTLLILGALQGMVDSKLALQYDPYPNRIAGIIQRNTAASDKLLIQGGGWGGRELICSKRDGLSVQGASDLARLCEGENLARLRELGFNRVVLLSESPLFAAVQQVNPGNRYERGRYPASVSPIVDAWPAVFQNEDIVIKQIPETGPSR